MAGFIIILRIFCHRKKFSMQRVKLDLIDRKILTDLQADGRMTNVELAQRVGISAPPCLRRVRALEEAGYIRGHHGATKPQPIGYGVTVVVMVRLDSPAEPALVAFQHTGVGWAPERRTGSGGGR